MQVGLQIRSLHDFYNKNQQSKQDHDSHQQLSYTIYDRHHQQHQDQQPVYFHHQRSHLNQNNYADLYQDLLR